MLLVAWRFADAKGASLGEVLTGIPVKAQTIRIGMQRVNRA